MFKNAKVKKINILDPFFNDINNKNPNDAYGIKVLKFIEAQQINAKISLQIRPEFLTNEYLEIVERMKNVIFEIGIQSLDKKVYPLIRRGNEKTANFVIQKLKNALLYKILIEGTLIYGLPNQNFDSFKNDVELLHSLGIKKITAFPLQIYLGTEIFETYKNFGLVAKENKLGILQIYDNPSHDFDKMAEFAKKINACEYENRYSFKK